MENARQLDEMQNSITKKQAAQGQAPKDTVAHCNDRLYQGATQLHVSGCINCWANDT
jgi:hypothetical protein